MTGKYSDRAAQEYLIFLMMKRNFAGAVSSSTKVSGECFHVVLLRKLIYIRFSQLAILQVKTSTFTNEQRQLGSECLRYDKWQKKMRIMFAFAGLTLTPRAQVYLSPLLT